MEFYPHRPYFQMNLGDAGNRAMKNKEDIYKYYITW